MLLSFQSVMPHFILEALAYLVGARTYWRMAARYPQPPSADRYLLLGFAIFGAFIGSIFWNTCPFY